MAQLSKEEIDDLMNPLRCTNCNQIINLEEGYYVDTGKCVGCEDRKKVEADIKFQEKLYCKKNVPITTTPGLMDLVY